MPHNALTEGYCAIRNDAAVADELMRKGGRTGEISPFARTGVRARKAALVVYVDWLESTLSRLRAVPSRVAQSDWLPASSA